jgi:NAD(P)-dependent dehydrogenase (short-subunit alcohol dehydrogenase family)
VASTNAAAGNLPYNCSKAAVDIVTKAMALELSPQGIRVNAINPALIDTPIFATTGAPAEQIETYKSFAAQVYPMRRIGNVADTTRAIIFLASDKSSFYTGVCLPVDGGYLASSVSILGMIKKD